MGYRNDFRSLKQSLIDGFSHLADVEHRTMQSEGRAAELLYLKTLCDPNAVNQLLVSAFLKADSEEEYVQVLLSLPGTSILEDFNQAVDSILAGHVAIFLEEDAYFLYDAATNTVSPVGEATVESSIHGPQDAFNEDMSTSLNQIRGRYQSSTLQVDLCMAGEKSKTKLAVVYDRDLADADVVEKVKTEIDRLETQLVQGAGDLLNQIGQKKWTLFPKAMVTERPDRVVKCLGRGRIAVIIDRTPFVMIVPSFFHDFFVSMDDQNMLTVVEWFMIALRYTGFFLASTLPGLYVAIISFNPEVFRVQLTFSVVASRAAVPYSSFLEVIFMLLMMEFLTEASIRLPRAIGPTATTVGGLILGQAATEAGLISNIMIIIVSLVAISNYVIPLIEMNFAVRVIKYLFVAIATFFGLTGIVLGIVGMVFYLATQESFGKPYIEMFRKEGR